MSTVIFGGTAAYHLTLDELTTVGERRILDTPYGPSAPFVRVGSGETWFSSRHGEDGLQRSAAFVNHRANLWAARLLGASAVYSWNGVGAITPGMQVGQVVIPHDLLDMTRARIASFAFDAVDNTPTYPEHTTAPFSEALRHKLIQACADQNIPHMPHGVYVCTEGPRLETAAEIDLFAWGGATIVGMTLAPEVWLAAELGIPYASLCIITNMATGRWHLDSRRDFGPSVGKLGLRTLLKAL